MLAWLGNLFSRKSSAPAQPTAAFRAAIAAIQAKYDSAQSTDENSRRWRQVDLLSAKAANSFNVRRTLRIRSRYVRDNNSYASGIIRNKVNDLISTGPTADINIGNEPGNKQIETAWIAWSRAVDFVGKLTTQTTAKIVDGEGFLLLTNNPANDDPVKLYPKDIEADQVTTPQPLNLGEFFNDGMTLDRLGNPISYHLLRSHPGDFLFPNLNPLEVDEIAARYVVQWFRKDRPGQVRGIPELTPALELFEQMRTFRMATLTAAETAALFTALLTSMAPADTSGVLPSPMTALPIERGMLTELPAGFELSQLSASHPNTTYETFVYCLLAEACRCLNVPLNIALGTSQKFNFSSARLDHLNYRDALKVERKRCEEIVLNRVFYAWLDEAIMIPGLLPDRLTPELVAVRWHWPGYSFLDPKTDADADGERLSNGTMTHAQYWAEQGRNWQEEFEQRAAEKKLADKLGLTPAEVKPGKNPSKSAVPQQDEDDAKEERSRRQAA